MEPPVVVPSTTVEEAMRDTCSTVSVKGLSIQLIDQINCIEPNVMKSFAGAPGLQYSDYVFPFMQTAAADTLVSLLEAGGTLTLTSALRTLPQQYLLYRWYQRGACNANLAAAPGRSNHNGGLAIDIADSSTWRARLRAAEFIDNVSGEPWHFEYTGTGTRDIRSLSVRAFQQLWNRNHPNDPIDEDGIYGPQTEGALQNSPADGFAIGPGCPTSNPYSIPADTGAEPEPIRE